MRDICGTHGRLRCSECGYNRELEDRVSDLAASYHDLYSKHTETELELHKYVELSDEYRNALEVAKEELWYALYSNKGGEDDKKFFVQNAKRFIDEALVEESDKTRIQRGILEEIERIEKQILNYRTKIFSNKLVLDVNVSDFSKLCSIAREQLELAQSRQRRNEFLKASIAHNLEHCQVSYEVLEDENKLLRETYSMDRQLFKHTLHQILNDSECTDNIAKLCLKKLEELSE